MTDPREIIGFYTVESNQAATLASDLRDRFVRLKVTLERLRDQYYDGASATSGKRGGVGKRISDIKRNYMNC